MMPLSPDRGIIYLYRASFFIVIAGNNKCRFFDLTLNIFQGLNGNF